MNLQSILVLVVIFGLLAAAILFITQNGGWQGGCGGNCAHCRNRCADPKPNPKNSGDKPE